MKSQLYLNPEEIYEKMLADIKQAKKEIFLETYIFTNDKIGRAFRDALTEKSSEGVKVQILLDAWGCNIREGYFKKLIGSGGQVRIFRKLRYAFRFINANHERNHRKLLLIDNKISYIGSINITASCLKWRELVLRIEGPMTNAFRKSFNRAWRMFQLLKSKKMKKIIHEGFEILHDFPSKRRGATERSYKKLIKNAKEKILIETPYFVPSRGVRTALKKAVKKGVSVVIMLPISSDFKFVDLFRSRYIGALHKKGVEIYYYPKFSHSKLLIIDDSFFLFGSSNLDYRSFRHQYEINVLGKDPDMIKSLKEYYNNGLKESKPFDYYDWTRRGIIKQMLEKLIEPLREYI